MDKIYINLRVLSQLSFLVRNAASFAIFLQRECWNMTQIVSPELLCMYNKYKINAQLDTVARSTLHSSGAPSSLLNDATLNAASM